MLFYITLLRLFIISLHRFAIDLPHVNFIILRMLLSLRLTLFTFFLNFLERLLCIWRVIISAEVVVKLFLLLRLRGLLLKRLAIANRVYGVSIFILSNINIFVK